MATLGVPKPTMAQSGWRGSRAHTVRVFAWDGEDQGATPSGYVYSSCKCATRQGGGHVVPCLLIQWPFQQADGERKVRRRQQRQAEEGDTHWFDTSRWLSENNVDEGDAGLCFLRLDAPAEFGVDQRSWFKRRPLATA